MERYKRKKTKLSILIFIMTGLLATSIAIIIIRGVDIQDINQDIKGWQSTSVDNFTCLQLCKTQLVQVDDKCCDSSNTTCSSKQSCLNQIISGLQDSIQEDTATIIYTAVPGFIFTIVILTLAIYLYTLRKAYHEQMSRRLIEQALINSQQNQQEELEYGFGQQSFESYEEFIQYLIDYGYILPGAAINPKKRGDERITASFVTVDNDSCSICMMEFSEEKVLKLRCNHKFHSQCIRDWNDTNPTCPICRTDIYE